MSDSAKNMQIKYPDYRYHDILVNSFLSVLKNNILVYIIFYNDRTLSFDDNNNSTFTLLRKENDGKFTHLYCGNDYKKVQEDLWPYIYEKKCDVLDVNELPDSIDEVIEYDYFNISNNDYDEDVSLIIKKILNRVGVYSDPNLKTAYFGIQDDLQLRLEIIHKEKNKEWENIKNRINDLIDSKKFDMSKGYILFHDVSVFFHEIEHVALSEEEKVKEEKDKEVKKNKGNLNKSMYVVLSMKEEGKDVLFFEFNSYSKIDELYSYNYLNISNNYESFKKPLIKHIDSYNLILFENKLIKENNEELGKIALNKKGVSYEFIIVPCENDRLYEDLRDSNMIFIDSDKFDFPKDVFKRAILREEVLITNNKTYYKENIRNNNGIKVENYLPIFDE